MKRDNARTSCVAYRCCHRASCCPIAARAACVGSTAGEGSLGLERRSELGRQAPGLARAMLGTFSRASNRYLSIGGAGPSSHRRRVPIIGAAMSEPAAAE